MSPAGMSLPLATSMQIWMPPVLALLRKSSLGTASTTNLDGSLLGNIR